MIKPDVHRLSHIHGDVIFYEVRFILFCNENFLILFLDLIYTYFIILKKCFLGLKTRATLLSAYPSK